MTEPSRKPATYQDVLDAPPHVIAELIAGELHLQPRPAKRHTYVHGGLHGLLHAPFMLGRGGPGGWWILFEPEVHLGDDVLVPDLAGWRRERTGALDVDVAHYETRPDWVCEILSPSTAQRDRLLKLDVYHRAEVPWAWLVDPSAQTVEVYEWSAKGWVRVAAAQAEDVAHLPPFDAVGLELGLVWHPGAP